MSNELVTIDAAMPINVDAAVARWDAYQSLCKRILTEDDYATISGKKARKRSGWRKLARFMGVSIEIISEERWEREGTFGYTFTVRANTKDGQHQDGDGLCDSTEFTGRITCTEHNVRSKALTRAKNRATADLIGGGEVSAEELDNGGDKRPPQKRKAQKGQGKAGPPNQPDSVLASQPRPWEPAHLKAVITKAITDKAGQPESDKMPGLRGVTVAALDGLFSHDSKEAATTQRHQLTDYLIGRPSAKDFNTAECRTLLGWAQEDADGVKIPSGVAIQEAAKVVEFVGNEAGQQALDMQADEPPF